MLEIITSVSSFWYIYRTSRCVHCPCVFNYLLCGDGAPSCVRRSVFLANWERVLCCSSALEVSVSTHTHCSRTNENTPRHLPKRDTPSPSPCPSTLVPPLSFITLFLSFLFLPSCSHLSLSLPSPLPPSPHVFYSHFSSFDPPPSPHFYHSCFLPSSLCHLPLSILSESVGGMCVLWCVCVCVCVCVGGGGGLGGGG